MGSLQYVHTQSEEANQISQAVLVRIIFAIQTCYFAVYKRDLSFFFILRTKSSCTIAPNICLFGCTSTCPGQTLSSDHVDARR